MICKGHAYVPRIFWSKFDLVNTHRTETLQSLLPENLPPASLLVKLAQYAAIYAEAGAGMSDAQP